ncbi:MAG: hypothetical protein AAB554_00120 [Patescibacteria group bacterium]
MKDEEVKKYAPYVLVGIAIGILLYAIIARPEAAPAPAGSTPADGTSPSIAAPAPDAIVGGETEAPSGNYPKKGLPYIESGYRFQFTDCHGSPGTLTVKRGKYFLLDNRDEKAVTIGLAGQSYKIGPYGVAVAAVWKAGTHQITCNGGGAASLVVQP